jgi:branched-chain amino acid transport system substrate-binding protein
MRISALLTGAAAAALAAAPASAEMTGNVIKIGVLNDQSSLYADLSGQGSVVAARMAIEDFGGSVNGTPVEVVSADHQNKPDVGSNIARQWYDVEGVDMIVDVPNSAVALAVNEVTREKNKVFLNSGAATSALTGDKCSPNTVHWTYDTWALANGTGKAVVQTGGDSWFFITADYAFGHALEKDTSEVVKENGGTVVGAVRHPLNTADFSSFLLQAQSSGAKVIGLANAGGDTTNSIKQASEFGIVESGQQLAALLLFLTDVHALGLPVAQGLAFTEAFYWDQNEKTREFAKEFAPQYRGIHPTMVHAGVYSATLHYLKALAALGSDGDGAAVVAKMKELPTDDILFGQGTIREDGRKIHDMYLFQVKTPEESKGEWDYYTLRATIPAAEAFRPLEEGGCPLVKS